MKVPMKTVLAVLPLLLGGVVHAAAIIDFEDWTAGTGYPYVIVAGGFDFAGLLSVSSSPGTNNSTNALHSLEPRFCKMGVAGGGSFMITSLDLQEGLGATGTVSVTLVGSRPGETSLTQSFNLDGDVGTYETFYPTGFSGLSTVYFYAYTALGAPSGGFSVDNIVVPEPGTLGLFLFSTAGVCARRRTRS